MYCLTSYFIISCIPTPIVYAKLYKVVSPRKLGRAKEQVVEEVEAIIVIDVSLKDILVCTLLLVCSLSILLIFLCTVFLHLHKCQLAVFGELI